MPFSSKSSILKICHPEILQEILVMLARHLGIERFSEHFNCCLTSYCVGSLLWITWYTEFVSIYLKAENKDTISFQHFMMKMW